MLTGTSSEFLGRRPLPHVIRERPVLVIIGPPGSGRTQVSRHLAGDGHCYLDTRALEAEVVARTREGRWSADVLAVGGVVLDGPVWMRNRPGFVELLAELLRARADGGLRSVICLADNEALAGELFAALPPGTLTTLGLRFPCSRGARVRFAMRICDQLGLSRDRAAGTERIEPWTYSAVIRSLGEQPTP